MNDAKDYQQALDIERQLVVCPFCAKKLEINPTAGTKSCFLHGDFMVTADRGFFKLEMRLMRFSFGP